MERFYSEVVGKEVAAEFDQIFSKKEKPNEINELTVQSPSGDLKLVEILATSGLVSSKTEARRLIEQNAVQVNDEKVTDVEKKLTKGTSNLLQVGKRRFLKVYVK